MTDKDAPDRDSRPWLNSDAEPGVPGPANENPNERPSELPEGLTTPKYPGETGPGASGELTPEEREKAMKPRESTGGSAEPNEPPSVG